MSEVTSDIIVPLWLNGKEETAATTYDIISPETGKTCWKAAQATPEIAIKAVEIAQETTQLWTLTEPTVRRDILLKAATILEERTMEYAGYMSTEMGANMGVSAYFVMPLAIRMLKDIAGRITGICGSFPVSPMAKMSALVLREPYGVTLGIVPWNAPFVFGIRSAATSIACGNTSILKASELSPRSYWAIGKAFHDAGLPAGVLNIISCPAADAAAVTNVMIEHPSVRKVDFTGSARVGKVIAKVCGENLKPCLMELGGKNCAVVLEDADIEKAVAETVSGAFANSGQICMATDLIILHSSIADAFLARLKTVLTDDPSCKPQTLVSSASKNRAQGLIKDAMATGGELFFNTEGEPGSNASFGPVVLKNVGEKAEFWKEESFAPMVGYVIVESEKEAIALANKSEYGLSAAVFTEDLRRGLAVAKRIQTGAVHINTMTIMDEPTLPFGGVKNSGWGRFNTTNGLDEFLVTKTITWND